MQDTTTGILAEYSLCRYAGVPAGAASLSFVHFTGSLQAEPFNAEHVDPLGVEKKDSSLPLAWLRLLALKGAP